MVRPILPPITPIRPIRLTGSAPELAAKAFIYASIIGVFTLAVLIMLRHS